MQNLQKRFTDIVLVILVIVLICVLGYVISIKKSLLILNQQLVNTEESKNIATDWRIYKNDTYGFELKYPNLAESLRVIGASTDYTEPEVELRTPFNYDQCTSEADGPGMSASRITISGKEYCLITVYGVEPGVFGYHYEYISHVRNNDIGIKFYFSGARDDEYKIASEAHALFIQILSTLRIL